MALFRRDSDMTSGPILGHLVRFALPALMGLLFQQLYSTVDSVVVGQFVGKTALAAVNATTSISNLLLYCCSALSVGAGVVISQCWGAHDETALKDAVATTMGLTVVLCVFSTAAGLGCTRWMLKLMDTPEDVFPEAQEYLSIYFAGISALLVYNLGSAILRSVGDSVRPLMFLIVSAVLNIVLDLLFVLAFDMKVDGVAWATVLSEVISAALVMLVLIREERPYGVRRIGLQWKMVKRILAISVPALVEAVTTGVCNIIAQSYINFFGSDAMAAWGVYSKADRILLQPSSALSQAVSTFTGQNIGAGNVERARKGVSVTLWSGLGVTAVLIALAMIFRMPIMLLFVKPEETEVLRLGSMFLLWISPCYLLTVIRVSLTPALRNANRSTISAFLTLVTLAGLRQLYLVIIKYGFGGRFHNPLSVGLSYPVGWLTCAIAMIALYLFCPLGPFANKEEAEKLGKRSA